MDQILHDKIKNKLTAFLNREPSENEVINGQNDSTLMSWIQEDDLNEIKKTGKLS